MIAIDGPDGAGKSTLAKQLLADHIVNTSLESPKRTMKPGETLTLATYRYLHHYADDNGVVVDRFIFSELVYGPILRQKTEFTSLETMRLLTRLLKSKSFVIFCMTETHNFKADENPEVIEKIQLIQQQYRLWYEACLQLAPVGPLWPVYRVLYYDWTRTDAYLELNREIVKAIHFPELLKKKG